MTRSQDMKLLALAFALTLLSCLSLFTTTAYTRFEPARTPPQTTRGEQPRIDTAWEVRLIETQRQEETKMAALVWMQIVEPIKITGELPLWGVLCAVGAGIAAVAALKVGLSAHEKLDQVRMEGIGEQIEALRDEMHEAIRTLMR